MLTDLSISNVAIIDKLRLTFGPGLTMLTGETGAGKSIIIDAVGLIMGCRATSDLIRSGEEEAVVEALFDVSRLTNLTEYLRESGFECDGELIIKRCLSRNGKNRIFINGSMAPLSILTDISSRLINIYGQHESQNLLKPENQLQLLDSFAGANELRQEFSSRFTQLQTIREQIANIDQHERETARRLDLLSFQSNEIQTVAPKPGEDIELEEERQLLANAEKLASTSSDAFDQLYGGDIALLGQLKRISAAIREIASIDHSLSDTAETLEGSYLQLEDAAMTLRGYAGKIDADPARLQQLDDRLDQIGRLKRKYGTTIEEILDFKRDIDQELDRIQNLGQDRQQLETAEKKAAEELNACGKRLGELRRNGATAMKKALEDEIHQLAMKNARINVELTPLSEPRSNGYEKLELLFSSNPGVEPRPLAKVASGGELSRLMLAFKQVLPESDVATLIFDEVDTGIGGATSDTVGQKLKKVAQCQQVLCITHLPQVAAFADNHLKVDKQIDHGQTKTVVTELDRQNRIEEIARMLGGATITETTLKHAAEMLSAAGNQGMDI